MKTKRALAAAIAVLLVCFILFACFFVLAESDHDCSGEDCPICQVIAVVEEIIKKIASLISVAAIIAAILTVAAGSCCATEQIVRMPTPVLRKDKLSD